MNKHLLAVLLTGSFLYGCAETTTPEGTSTQVTTSQVSKPVQYTPLNTTGVSYAITEENENIQFTEAKGTTINLIVPRIYNGSNTDISLFDINSLANAGLPADFPGQNAQFPGPAFNFIKLDKDTGINLPETDSVFGCVFDINTGLTWENKISPKFSDLSAYNKLHNSVVKHSWYNPDADSNGGDAGQRNGGICSTAIIASDTNTFIQQVNDEKLCGLSDWRLPTAEELRSIVNYESATLSMLDPNFFPNTADTLHRWTSQTNPLNIEQAYGFHFHEGRFQAHTKYCASNGTTFHNGALLVRGPG